jgi:hypothetical protein
VNSSKTGAEKNLAQSAATIAENRVHWADGGEKVTPELEALYEAARVRNWITEGMVEQYRKHWHCSRAAALERLLTKRENE